MTANLPTDSAERKKLPVFSGVVAYFPDALAAVAEVSFKGNQQHNPGEPLHWAREKSTDHEDCIMRHMLELGTRDKDDVRHAAKLAWRALAVLQLEIEADQTIPWEQVKQELGLPTEQLQAMRDAVDQVFSLDPRHFQLTRPAREVFDEIEKELDLEEAWGEEPVTTEPPLTEVQKLIVPIIAEANAAAEIPCDCPTCTHARNYAAKLIGQPGEFENPTESDNVKVVGIETSTPRCYEVGPMTDYEYLNCVAFDEGQERLEMLGWDVISPMNLDREAGIDPMDPSTYMDVEIGPIIRRDVNAILSLDPKRGDRLALLPGWELSTGSIAEVMLGRWLGLEIMDTFGNLISGDDVIFEDLCRAFYNYLEGKDRK